PIVVFEFGYAEPYDDLKADVKLLLEGTEGKITKAVIIKLQPLREGGTEIQKGFVDMWHLCDGQAQKCGGRKNLFPPPASHASQKLEISLKDILHEEFGNLASNNWSKDNTLVLKLDSLWKSINKATKRHLFRKGVLEEE
ncbi:hypothetical protein L873DRAFT_1711644, partial [Choiromyces venosus 120613-1]